jgi:hypothetical protein
MMTFVTNLVEPYLKYMNNSLIDYGDSRGLIGLTLVSVCSLFICSSFSHNIEWHSSSALSVHLKLTGLSRNPGPSILNIKLFLQNILRASIHSRSGQNSIRLAILVELNTFIRRSKMTLLQTFRRQILASVHSILVAVPLNHRFFVLIYPTIHCTLW